MFVPGESRRSLCVVLDRDESGGTRRCIDSHTVMSGVCRCRWVTRITTPDRPWRISVVARVPGSPAVFKSAECRGGRVSSVRSPIYGRMFWLRRKKFVGSYLRLITCSRSYFASP
jgi:hypothetical protein